MGPMPNPGEYKRYLLVAYCMSIPPTLYFSRFGILGCLVIYLLSGFVVGSSFYLMSQITRRIRLRSFALQLILQSLSILTTLVVSTATVMVGSGAIIAGRSPFDPVLLAGMGRLLTPHQAAAGLAAGFTMSLAINFFFAIGRKLGPGVMWSWMTGKYYAPREEEMVVMFLDMKDSTTLAEGLGTIAFSQLVKDFFADLTGPLLKTGARVSHYIGDEAVITWSPSRGLKKGGCLNLVPEFRRVLESRSGHYQAAYGLVPEFKAGAHIGLVVATEVGEIKSEIVLHGDTLNTAARIQGLCGPEGEMFLVSGELAGRLPDSPVLVALGERQVKGREKGVDLYAVRT